jgi:hypothetical protein
MKQSRAIVLVAVLAAAGLASAVLSGQDDSMRQAKDRAEIEQLMWRYARALDAGDGTAYASAYAADGQFVGGANATKGREALKKMVDDLRAQEAAAKAKGEARPPMYHMHANSWLEFVDKDHARFHAYYLTAMGPAGQNVPLRVAAVGRSIDHLERVNGTWLIKTRDVAPRD